MDSIVENQTHLKTLTEGIHSKEALQLVREHVLGVMGPASMAYSTSLIKMAKLQVCLLHHCLVTAVVCLHACIGLHYLYSSYLQKMGKLHVHLMPNSALAGLLACWLALLAGWLAGTLACLLAGLLACLLAS